MSGTLLNGNEVKIADAYDNGVYELGVLERMHDIEVLTENIKLDNKLLSGYMDDNLSAQKMNFGIAGLLSGITVQLEDIKKQMSSEYATWSDAGNAILATAESSFNAGRTSVVDKLMAIVDPLVESVTILQDSILNKMGIPDLPIIGNIQKILKEIANIGRVVSKVDPKLREEARNRARKEKDDANKNKGWFASVCEDSWLETIINEIIEIIRSVFNLIKDIISLIEPFLMMMLIEKLKPVIEFFSLALGEIYGICENIVSLGKMLIFNQAKLLDMFAQAIVEKISEIWDIFRYVVYGGTLPNDAMISALVGDIVSCENEISGKQLEIELIKSNQKEYELSNSIDEAAKKQEYSIVVDTTLDLDKQQKITRDIDTDIQIFKILEDPNMEYAKRMKLMEKLPALQQTPIPNESEEPRVENKASVPEISKEPFVPPIQLFLNEGYTIHGFKNNSGEIFPILRKKGSKSVSIDNIGYNRRIYAKNDSDGNVVIDRIEYVYNDGEGNRDTLTEGIDYKAD